MSNRRDIGFTLIELLAALAIAVLLSLLAYPAFKAALCKSRRSDARVTLMRAQMLQERYRAEHAAYASNLDELGLSPVSGEGHYLIAVGAGGFSDFELQARAVGAQSADERCRHMKLVVHGVDASYQSGQDVSMGNGEAANRECWGHR